MSHGEELLILAEESKQCKVTASPAERLRIISLAVGQLTFNASVMTRVNRAKMPVPIGAWVRVSSSLCDSELHQVLGRKGVITFSI